MQREGIPITPNPTLQSPIPNCQSPILNPQSAIGNPQSPIVNPQSPIGNRQSATSWANIWRGLMESGHELSHWGATGLRGHVGQTVSLPFPKQPFPFSRGPDSPSRKSGRLTVCPTQSTFFPPIRVHPCSSVVHWVIADSPLGKAVLRVIRGGEPKSHLLVVFSPFRG